MKSKLKKALLNLYDSYIYKMTDKRLTKQWINNCKRNHINANEKALGEEEFCKFWSHAFGKHPVDIYSYRLFSRYMGNVPCIIPEVLGVTLLEKHLNPMRYRDFYSDKNAYPMYFPITKSMPKTLMARICGGAILTYLEQENKFTMLFSKDEIYELSASRLTDALEGYDKVCIKPSVDTCSGVGVKLFVRQGNQFKTSEQIILDGSYLSSLGDDFVIQEVIEQHSYMKQFNPSSLNTLRICVYRSVVDEKPHATASIIRVGANGSFVDNAHAGGRFVGIDVKTGKLHPTTLDQYGTKQNVWNGLDYSKNEYVIPKWNEIQSFAERIAEGNIHSRLLAFDICLDAETKPRIVEINTGGFSWWLFLYTGQDVFAGETKEVIEYCMEKAKVAARHIQVL